MKKKYTLLFLFALIAVGSLIFSTPTFADDAVSTSFFGNFEDDGKGCGVYMVLNLVLEILTYGIAIAATIGIVVSGITYLTAKGNEAQATKSKRRIYEIVIGIAVYAVLWAILSFLLPGGTLNNSPQCSKTDKGSSMFDERHVTLDNDNNNSSSNNNSNNSQNSNNNNSSNNNSNNNSNNTTGSRSLDSICEAPSKCSWSERIAQTAEALAWPYGTKKNKYDKTMYGRDKCFKSWSQLKKTAHPTKAFQIAYDKVRPKHWGLCSKAWGNGTALGASCDVFAGTVVTYSGYDKDISFGLYKQTPHLKKSSKWKKVKTPKRGDFCNSNGHSSIYLGNNRVAQAGYGNRKIGGRVWGHIDKGKCGGMNIYRPTR